ncbi:MAG: TetR/AcrR family transcriptional regulator C-terminal domain-containing protein [Acidimicrobiia bacterium]|nr:TetR/AcrR family transcriptional regulator C-terminal domain-containing protein [Acidimicrobiia bacterium]
MSLTKERVLDGAMALADDIGIEAFTIRKLAAALDVKPMTIYHHIPSKEQILDGMVDIVFSQIALPPEDLPWEEAIRVRCRSMRDVLKRHWWAAPLMESRLSPGHETLLHHDAVLGCLRRGGLSLSMTAHAIAVLDSYLYGFAFEEAHLPGGGGEEIIPVAEDLAAFLPPDVYPNLYEFTTEHVMKETDYSFGNSFEFGLDLIIDALRAAAQEDAG